MPELTRKDLKEVFTETLEPFAKAVQEDFRRVDQRFDGIEVRLGGVEQRLGRVEAEVREIKDHFSELFTKLDEFISLYKKQEQELLMLASQMKRFEERLSKLESQQK